MNKFKNRIPLLKVGDEYIHITKYGGRNIGKVVRIDLINCCYMDNNRSYYYQEWIIINEKGIQIQLNGSDGSIYKIKNIVNKQI